MSADVQIIERSGWIYSPILRGRHTLDLCSYLAVVNKFQVTPIAGGGLWRSLMYVFLWWWLWVFWQSVRRPLIRPRAPLKNVGGEALARRICQKKRSLHAVNEYFFGKFNDTRASKVIFQRFPRFKECRQKAVVRVPRWNCLWGKALG